MNKTIVVINGTSIEMLKEGNKLIPIKPICKILGIDEKSQRDKINNDEILSSVKVLNTSTGSDNKEYKMFSLPLKYIFGCLQ